MAILRVILELLFILPAAAWLGSAVMLGAASRVIQMEMAGRRTEAWHIVRRLRAIFQRIEGVIVLVAWAATIAHAAMIQVAPQSYGAAWSAAIGVQMGLLFIATVIAGVISLWLLRRIAKLETLVGSYGEKDVQIKVRKRIALLHRWIELLNVAAAAVIAAALTAAVIAIA
ncbi:MAG: hypothetical protein ACE15C_02080 [Phycisphaerae bacterium]